MSYDVVVVDQPQKLYRNVRCDGCSAVLKHVEPSLVRDDGTWECLQPDDALVVCLNGGYGMAIDPCVGSTESELTQLFCGTCVKKLCTQWPSIARVVEKFCSSSLGL
jgi:hypothetical protein